MRCIPRLNACKSTGIKASDGPQIWVWKTLPSLCRPWGLWTEYDPPSSPGHSLCWIIRSLVIIWRAQPLCCVTFILKSACSWRARAWGDVVRITFCQARQAPFRMGKAVIGRFDFSRNLLSSSLKQPLPRENHSFSHYFYIFFKPRSTFRSIFNTYNILYSLLTIVVSILNKKVL